MLGCWLVDGAESISFFFLRSDYDVLGRTYQFKLQTWPAKAKVEKQCCREAENQLQHVCMLDTAAYLARKFSLPTFWCCNHSFPYTVICRDD